jgi:hypothetical protein
MGAGNNTQSHSYYVTDCPNRLVFVELKASAAHRLSKTLKKAAYSEEPGNMIDNLEHWHVFLGYMHSVAPLCTLSPESPGMIAFRNLAANSRSRSQVLI